MLAIPQVRRFSFALCHAGALIHDHTMSKNAVVLLRAHLDQQAANGATHIGISADAKAALSNLVRNPVGKRREAAAEAKIKRIEADAARPSPAAAPRAALPESEANIAIPVQGATLEEKLGRLAVMAEEDAAPMQLGSLRDIMVWSAGNLRAELMFIGDAPGEEEERQREPFVGPDGRFRSRCSRPLG